MHKSFRQVGSSMNRNRYRPAPFADHDVMAAGDAIQAPAMFFEKFFELFAGHERVCTAYKVYVKLHL